jgi:hypothetical protein
LKIFFAPDTRAVRVVWLFEELGLPYELELFKLGDASMRSSAYLGIHPLGRVPTLVDDKVTIFESGAIVHPDHVNAKNFPRLAALSERAMKIDAFASTVPHL